MLPRDLGWHNYNVLRGEGRLPVRESSGIITDCRSVPFNPHEIEHRLLPWLQIKPDFVIPYAHCWPVPGATHRIQIPSSIIHHNQHYYHHQHQRQRQQQQNLQRHYQQYCQRRRHFQLTARRRHSAAQPSSIEQHSAYDTQRDILVDSGMETR